MWGALNGYIGRSEAGAAERRQALAVTPVPVTLHVYDLGSAFAGVNMLGRAVGTGAFHAAVEVHGKEWSFGAFSDGPHGSGIFWCPPKGCSAHSYREGLPMGDTTLSKKDFNRLLDKLAREWPGSDYDLLRRNCCHFSAELCDRLGVGPVPAWVTSLAGVGAALRSSARMVVRGAVNAPIYAAQGIAAAPFAAYDALMGPAESIDARGAESGTPAAERPSDAPGELQRQGSGAPAELRRQGSAAPGPPSTVAGPQPQAGNLGAGLKAGDAVEVFSNSCKSWCGARVESVDRASSSIVVSFRLPGAGPSELSTKVLPFNHKSLRRASPGAADAAWFGAASREPAFGPADAFGEGQAVEVYSNTHGAWCPGQVERTAGNMLSVAFLAPGSGPGEWSRKDIPADHKDVRATGDAQKAVQKDLKVGDWVEVFSHASQSWVLSRVSRLLRGGGLAAAFQLPGAAEGEWEEKRVLPGSSDLRRPPGTASDVRGGGLSADIIREDRPALDWSREERAAYSKLMEGLCDVNKTVADMARATADAARCAEFLKSSGLPRRVLKEIWSVSNPAGLDRLSSQEFYTCCRLVGHCQALLGSGDASAAEVLAEGAADSLQLLMQWELLEERPPKLPEFAAVPGGH